MEYRCKRNPEISTTVQYLCEWTQYEKKDTLAKMFLKYYWRKCIHKNTLIVGSGELESEWREPVILLSPPPSGLARPSSGW
jgi:hypothetical protein